MTLNQIVFAIKEKTKDFVDDEVFPIRYIEFLVQTKRSKYVKAEIDNLRYNTDATLIQSICAPLEYTDESDCCGTLKTCKILRTVDPIPSVFTGKMNSGIQLVGPIDRVSRPFSAISPTRVAYIEDSPFSNGVYWFYHTDGRIYIISKQDSINLLKQVRVVGIFEDMAELKEYTSCTTSATCFTNDTEYPLQSYMIDQLINEIATELINGNNATTEDIVNDSARKQSQS